MSFVEMTNEDWEAVYKHHDALIRMAELEMRAEIRETTSGSNQAQSLQPAEAAAHQL
ncbi:MAG: hypothetical protein V4567_06940 [Pseudomonadota bacterium]